MYQINPYWGVAVDTANTPDPAVITVLGLTPTVVESLSGIAWNPADIRNDSTVGTLSNGNRTLTRTSGPSSCGVRSIDSHLTGKWYFEFSITTAESDLSNKPYGGIVPGTTPINTFSGVHGPFPGTSGDRGTYLASPPNFYAVYRPGTNVSFEGPAVVQGDVFGYAIDATLGRFWCHKNGVYADGDPSLNTAPSITGLSGVTWYAFAIVGNSVITGNFSDSDMQYPIPTGFLAWDGSGSAGSMSIQVGVGALVATGRAPTSVHSGAYPQPGAGSAVITGRAPTVLRTANPGIGSAVITGRAPTVV